MSQRDESRIDRNEQVSQAIQMLRDGYRTSIVHLQTGLNSTMVRACHRELTGGDKKASAGALPNTMFILKDPGKAVEASLFSAIYLKLGGKAVLKSVDMDVLTRSYRIYERLRKSHDCSSRRELGINRGWVVARDLRARLVEMTKCCGCSASFLYAIHSEVACPFCLANRTRNRNLSNPKTYDFGSVVIPMLSHYDDTYHEAGNRLVAKWSQ